MTRDRRPGSEGNTPREAWRGGLTDGPPKLRTAIRALDETLFGGFRDHYPKLLARELALCRSLLDVGCGKNSPINSIAAHARNLRTIGIDIHEPEVRESQRLGIHDQYVILDVVTLGSAFNPDSFDCVLASDLIEHLTKAQGAQLLGDMERLARKRVLVFTPNGFLEQPPSDDNPWQAHQSGWTLPEFRQRRYRVIGVNGWRRLRTHFAEIAFHPTRFWTRVSYLTQPLTENHPRWAFQLLAVKDIS